MSYLTKYGSIFGALPMTLGNVIFVAPSATYYVAGKAYTASDGNDGLSPERAKLTIDSAINQTTANSGDIVALLPGTHTSANAAADVAGVTFVGLPYFPQAVVNDIAGMAPPVTVTGSTGVGITVTAADNTFYNIRFVPVTQQIAVSYSAAATRLKFVHCMVDNTGVTGHANTRGIVASAAAANVMLSGCLLRDASVTTSCGPALVLGASTHFFIDKTIVYKDGSVASGTAWTTAITVADGCSGTFRELDYIGTEVSVGCTKVVTGASLTGAGVVHAIRCTMTVNTGGLLFDDFAAADMDLCLNYVATVAGGTGGTLITAST